MDHIIGIENYVNDGPCAVTIGKFDALHLGHRLLVDNVVAKKKDGLKAVAIIFSNSPRIALGREQAEPKFIITKSERKVILESLGIDILLELVFDENMIKMEPEDFTRLLCETLNMEYLCVGDDFRFGFRGRGDVLLLSELAPRYGFDLNPVKKVEYKDEVISSTRIREDITNGNLVDANHMLGYEFFIKSTVVHGNRIGTTLDYPTINLIPSPDKILPPFGAYASYTNVSGRLFAGMTNIGIRPTVNNKDKKVTIETHLFDFYEDIYEKEVEVSFVEFIRSEMKFDSVNVLRDQIAMDEAIIRKILK